MLISTPSSPPYSSRRMRIPSCLCNTRARPLPFLKRRRGASPAPYPTGAPDWLRGGVSAKNKRLRQGSGWVRAVLQPVGAAELGPGPGGSWGEGGVGPGGHRGLKGRGWVRGGLGERRVGLVESIRFKSLVGKPWVNRCFLPKALPRCVTRINRVVADSGRGDLVKQRFILIFFRLIAEN